jgi:hypothetical protein
VGGEDDQRELAPMAGEEWKHGRKQPSAEGLYSENGRHEKNKAPSVNDHD